MTAHDLPNRIVWDDLIRRRTVARAQMDLAYASGEPESVTDQLNDKHAAALDACLLTPAGCLADVRAKLELIDDWDIADGWWCAQEAIAILALDAKRLLPVDHNERLATEGAA
ncbi:hypothetical protein [Pelagerythrobacter marensis]|uniref:Uncharacterized protein n=1 Tax=Pelagerythrobacter marensis TaxID=543877 RepID=A0A0G3X701_9SPHN|nr:hypothetical protein [Pelagerythrobacter marensis]AKM06128.1 hypothetical protein AM2010_34 [Pelagerythrobacter marensis]